MKSYNTKTSRDWDKYKKYFETKGEVKRKTLKQPLNLDLSYSSMTDRQRQALSLFKLKSIQLDSFGKYQEFINFISDVPDQNSLAFEKIYLDNED